MGRNKLDIKKLSTLAGQQITFSKRKLGIMKKARELSILCDVNVLLVIFSTSGKPTCCVGGDRKFEDIIYKYAGLSPQERLKRKLESLQVLSKAFKKGDHKVNVDQLNDPVSYEVEEVKQQIINCRDEINRALSFLGPLAEFDSISHIEDPNKMIAMENQIKYFIAKNKENVNNYAQGVMEFHEGRGSASYTTPDHGQQIMLPYHSVTSQMDLAEYKLGHHGIDHPTHQDTTWAPSDGTQQIITGEIPGLMHTPREAPVCKESFKADIIPENMGHLNENQNQFTSQGNQFMYQGQQETSTVNANSYEAGDLRQEMTCDEGDDFFSALWQQNENAYCDTQTNN